MKYLYVLVSTASDIYYEQFLLSLTSLRLVMPDADVVLLCDAKTKETLSGKRAHYEKLLSQTITVDVPDNIPQVEISRWIKTSIRRYIAGDFLFIDCDTIITEDLSSIEDQKILFGACLDKHSLLSRHGRALQIAQRDKLLGFSSYTSNRHFNSGVIYCADTPETHVIFERWHELWQFSNSKNVVRDQPSFNMAIYENLSVFTELNGIWNCQISFNGLPFLINSKIIHYFASDFHVHETAFMLASKNVLNEIKETGFIPDTVMELLKNPKSAFVPESRIIAGNDLLSVMNSSLFDAVFLLKQKAPGVYNFINTLSSVSKKIVRFFMVRKSKKKDGGITLYN